MSTPRRGLTLLEVLAAAVLLAMLAAASAPMVRSMGRVVEHEQRLAAMEALAALDADAIVGAWRAGGRALGEGAEWLTVEVQDGEAGDAEPSSPSLSEPVDVRWLRCRLWPSREASRAGEASAECYRLVAARSLETEGPEGPGEAP